MRRSPPRSVESRQAGSFDAVLRFATLFALAASLLLAVGCGGDDETRPPAATDEAYVAGFCQASLELSQSLPEPATATGVTSELLRAMAPAFHTYASSLNGLQPPAGLESFHEAFVTEIENAAVQLETGDTTVDPFLALEQLTPPEEVSARFQAIAERNAVCQQAGITFAPSPQGEPGASATPGESFVTPSVDYSNPESFTAAGPQSTLSPASLAAVVNEFGTEMTGLVGVGRVHRWMASTFRTEASGGATIGTTDVNSLIGSRVLTGCHDWALVMTSVLRSFGYPALMVDTAGLQWAADYAAGKTGPFVGHVFAELFVDGSWVLVDCTGGNYTADYDATNPVIPYAGAGDARGFYAMFKGVDPASYGVVSNDALQRRMIAFAMASSRLEIRLPAYRWQPLP